MNFEWLDKNRNTADQLRMLLAHDGLSARVKRDIDVAISQLHSIDQKFWHDAATNLIRDAEAEIEANIQRKYAQEEARQAIADEWEWRLTRKDHKRRPLKKGPTEPSLVRTRQLQKELDKIEAMRPTNTSQRQQQPQ